MKNSKIMAIILVAALVLSTMTMFVSADTSAKVFDTNKIYGQSVINDGTTTLKFINTGSNITQTENTADPAGGSNKVTLFKYSGTEGTENSVAQVKAHTAEGVNYPLSEIRYDFYLTGLSYLSTQVTVTSDYQKRQVLTSYVKTQAGQFVQPLADLGIVYYETATDGETDLVFYDGSVCEQNKWYTVIYDISQAESSFDVYVIEKGASDSTARYLYKSRTVGNQESWNPNIFSINMFYGKNTQKENRKIYLDNVTFRPYIKASYSQGEVRTSSTFNTLTNETLEMVHVGNTFPENKRPAISAIATGATFNLSSAEGRSGKENDKAVKITITSNSKTYEVGKPDYYNNGVQIYFQESALGNELTAKYANSRVDFDLYPITAATKAQPVIFFPSYYDITDANAASNSHSVPMLCNGKIENKIKNGQWNHITIIYDNDNSERLIYVNGDHVLTDVLKARGSEADYTRNITGIQVKLAGNKDDAWIIDNFSVAKAGKRCGGTSAEFGYVAGDAGSYKFFSDSKFDISTDATAGIYVKDESGNVVAGTVSVTNNAEGSVITFTPSEAPKAYSDLKLIIPASAKLLRADASSYEAGAAYEIPFHINDTEGCYVSDLTLNKDEENNKAVATVKVRSTTKPTAPIAMFYAASYQENRLQQIDMLSIKPTDTVISTYTAEVPFDSNTTTTKAFLWDSVYAPVYYAEK